MDHALYEVRTISIKQWIDYFLYTKPNRKKIKVKLKTFLNAIATATVVLCAAPVFASQIVGSASSNTGNCFPFGCAYSGDYQQVYTASAFSGPISITGLDFFNTSFRTSATGMNSGNWTISLSTTARDWNTLSSSTASNIGTDNTSVFTGNLSQPWAFGDTLQINLSTPFTYNPQNGNLLMNVMVSGASDSDGAIYFDVQNGGSIMARNYHGNVQDNFGLVTGFETGTVPEPASLALLGLGIVGLALHRRKQNT